MNDPLRRLAMKLLARREHSCAELEQKLSRAGDAAAAAAVVEELRRSGLASDRRFAESYIRAHAERVGAGRLRQALRGKGVDAEIVDGCLADAALPDELARARAIWQRKFGSTPVDRKEWAKQARFLQGRGFSGETIHRLLRAPEDES